MRVLSGHRGRVRSLAFAPDGSRLASCSDDGTVRLWDYVTGRRPRTLRGHRGTAYHLAFEPGGRRLATAGADRVVRLWPLPDGRGVQSLRGHEALVTSLAFCGTGTLASGAGNYAGELMVWDTERLQPSIRQRTASGVWSVAFAPGPAGLLAVGIAAEPGEVQLWKFTAQRPTARLETPTRVRSVAFTGDGRLLAAASGPDALVWPIEAGRPARKPMWRLSGHAATIHGLDWAPDGRTLATASFDGTVRTWDAETGQERHCFDWGVGRLNCVALAPAGMTVAAGGERDIIVWDADEG